MTIETCSIDLQHNHLAPFRQDRRNTIKSCASGDKMCHIVDVGRVGGFVCRVGGGEWVLEYIYDFILGSLLLFFLQLLLLLGVVFLLL